MTPPRTLLFDLLASRAVEPGSQSREGVAIGNPLRESIRRELALLFNSTALAASEPFAQLPHAEESTLNYGLPDLAGKTASSLDERWLAAQLTRAIRSFEPRLQADSVRVRVRPHRAVSHNVVSFEIDAALQHSLGADNIELDSELDLESGAAQVAIRPQARRGKDRTIQARGGAARGTATRSIEPEACG
jgi:type VI secretion system protein ImpF